MSKARKGVVWFGEVDKRDLPLVGGKGANLGEMTKAGIPVPPGFIVTTNSYMLFLEETGLKESIAELLRPLNSDDTQQLNEVSAKIKKLMTTAKMPERIAEEIREAYRRLGGLVAVRSSATAEDQPEASFAGQQRTFLNIEGEDSVVSAVQECWASLFEPRAIFYRQEQQLDHVQVGIAVPVQKMVQSEISGIMFTVEPLSCERDKVTIEAVYGLGEAVVSGEITPDHYLVSKDGMTILDKQIARQETHLVKRPDKSKDVEETNVWLPVPEEMRDEQKLTDGEIVSLAKLGLKIEQHYKFPQDVEWARQDGHMYIVQTRPVTTLTDVVSRPSETVPQSKVIISGSPASPGLGSGAVKIVKDAALINEVKLGDILVAEMTTPDFVPAMKRASGIVTDRGGRTCHAAIVSRELGIPCIVGAGEATQVLEPTQVVTVDGTLGKVYEGVVEAKAEPCLSEAPKPRVKTRTKVYINLAEPGLAEAMAAKDVDGVGLLRAEFMISEIGEHPRFMLKEGRGEEFTVHLANGLMQFAEAFDPRPVVYRTTDFKTNEYRHLKGGADYEEHEENPMIGYRGCSRYVREFDIFRLEIEAVKRVRQKHRNLWVMLPFVRTVDELARVKEMVEAEGLSQSNDFRLWMMVEVPSNVFLIDEFLDVGVDGVSIGSNDLTQLILGIDRDNEKFDGYVDERNEAVLLAIERVVKSAVARGVTASICGQAASDFPEITEKLVEWGITSVSVNRDVIDKTRDLIASAEQRLSGVG